MSANTSARKARAAILSAPAADYRAWELLATCRRCDRHAVSAQVGALGAGTIADGIRRLRCGGCGGRPSDVWITRAGEGWRRVTVKLEGDGAYG